MIKYQHALNLHQNFNDEQQNETWLQLNFQQNYTARNDKNIICDNSTNNVLTMFLISKKNISFVN